MSVVVHKDRVISGHTFISDQNVHGVVLAQDSVALEDGHGLGASVGNGDVEGVVTGASDLDGQRASSHGCASKGGDGQNLGKHLCG